MGTKIEQIARSRHEQNSFDDMKKYDQFSEDFNSIS